MKKTKINGKSARTKLTAASLSAIRGGTDFTVRTTDDGVENKASPKLMQYVGR